MEISSFTSSNEMVMEDLVFCQEWSVDSIFNELISPAIAMPNRAISQDFSHSYSNNNNNNNNTLHSMLDFEQGSHNNNRPLKQLKTTTSWNSCKPENVSSDFDNQSIISTPSYGKQNYVLIKSNQAAKRISSANVVAERKRREKLNQRFVALSALIPQLKKMDKASILEDAIQHLKKLQDKVNFLEVLQKSTNDYNNNNNKKKKKRSSAAMESSSSDESNSSGSTIINESSTSLPEIKTRVCNNDVLIQIHCHKRKGAFEKVVGEIEKLNLSVVNSSIMTFGDSSLSISLVAQKDEKITLDMKELVKNLHGALSR